MFQVKETLAAHADCNEVHLAGHFGESDILFRALEDQLASPGRRFIQRHACGSAIVKGAVLYGLAPRSKITERVMQESFGMASAVPYTDEHEKASTRDRAWRAPHS